MNITNLIHIFYFNLTTNTVPMVLPPEPTTSPSVPAAVKEFKSQEMVFSNYYRTEIDFSACTTNTYKLKSVRIK